MNIGKKRIRTMETEIEKVENIAKYSTTSIFSLQLYPYSIRTNLEKNTENKG